MSDADNLLAMREFMAFITSMPELLAPAPRWVRFQVNVAARRRLLVENHLCLRCGEEADAALLTKGVDGVDLRWLDLCVDCVDLLRRLGRAEAGRDEP